MINGNESVLDRLDNVLRGLKSLAEVDAGDKYYYDPNAMTFHKSGALLVDATKYALGEGYVSKFLTGASRLLSGESHVYFSAGLTDLENKIREILCEIEVESHVEATTTDRRWKLLSGLRDLSDRIGSASRGIKRLVKSSYQGEEDKKKVILCHYEMLNETLTEKVETISLLIMQHNMEAEDKKLAEMKSAIELQRYIEETNGRLKIHNKYQDLIAKAELNRLEQSQFFRDSTPHPMTGLSINDIRFVRNVLSYGSNKTILPKRLEEQTKRDPKNPFLYLRPKQTRFPYVIQYFADKLFIHLKGSKHNGRQQKIIGRGSFKVISMSVVLNDPFEMVGRVYANGVSRVSDPCNHTSSMKISSDNERHCLQMLKGVRGVVDFLTISRYQTKKEKGQGENTKAITKQSIMMRYYNRGDLKQYTSNSGLDLTKPQFAAILLDILSALEAMHDLYGLVHLDIKPDNILLEDETEHAQKNGLAGVLCDFGFCCSLDRVRPAGTPYYLSPEVASAMFGSGKLSDIGPPADIWSLGATGWLVLTGEKTPAMEHLNRVGKMTPAFLSILRQNDALPEPAKGTIKHLLWRMMNPDPLKRPTAAEAKGELNSIIKLY